MLFWSIRWTPFEVVLKFTRFFSEPQLSIDPTVLSPSRTQAKARNTSYSPRPTSFHTEPRCLQASFRFCFESECSQLEKTLQVLVFIFSVDHINDFWLRGAHLFMISLLKVHRHSAFCLNLTAQPSLSWFLTSFFIKFCCTCFSQSGRFGGPGQYPPKRRLALRSEGLSRNHWVGREAFYLRNPNGLWERLGIWRLSRLLRQKSRNGRRGRWPTLWSPFCERSETVQRCYRRQNWRLSDTLIQYLPRLQARATD